MYKIFEIRDNETDELVYIGCIKNDIDIRSICNNKTLLSDYIHRFKKDRFSYVVIQQIKDEHSALKEVTELVEFWKPLFYNENHSFENYIFLRDIRAQLSKNQIEQNFDP